MSRGIRRITLAVAAGYLTNGVLVAATELSLGAAGIGAPPYFVVDLISQCLFTIVAGYLCCLIAGPTRRAAMAGLMGWWEQSLWSHRGKRSRIGTVSRCSLFIRRAYGSDGH
jgi:hypothetical protein